MPLNRNNKLEQVIRIISLVSLSFIVCYGLILVILPIKPFWVDEWRVIYNLKFKTPDMLWGQLDYMQQFPRVYLQIIKYFTSLADYSYFSLRLPSFLVGTFSIVFCWQLMRKIFPGQVINGCLFVITLISTYSFTEYYIQIKQYTMDVLLTLVAIWQMIELLRLKDRYPGTGRYLLLCAGFFVLPYFSYSYPIAIAPVFVIVLMQSLRILKDKISAAPAKKIIQLWFPLLLCTISIVFFYVIDVKQLMADKGMQQFWATLMMRDGFDLQLFVVNFYLLFSEIGSGLIFTILFGIVGIAAFGYALYKFPALAKKGNYNTLELCTVYSVLLVLLGLVLFVAGKIPLGNARLNTFAFPAITILIIYFLEYLKTKAGTAKVSVGISIVLFLGVTGNIYTSSINAVSGKEYEKKLLIYNATEKAIRTAQEQNLPVFITPGVTFPYEITKNLPDTTLLPGDWIFKTLPAYKASIHIPVYPIGTLSDLDQATRQLPPDVKAVMAGDGINYQVVPVNRN